MVDSKAKKILFNTYWSSAGWRDPYYVSNEDFEYAKSKGIMFDPINMKHDDILKDAIKMRNSVKESDLVKGFLASLSNRDLRLRSAIQSYFNLKDLSIHSFQAGKHDLHYICAICEQQKETKNFDLNVLNFERFKWGGVRNLDILYNLFDLSLFKKMTIPEPTEEDISIMKDILDCIESSPVQDNHKKLEKRLSKVIKTNKNEREKLVEILGGFEILEPQTYDKTDRHQYDWAILKQWRGSDKYNKEQLKKKFGKWLS